MIKFFFHTKLCFILLLLFIFVQCSNSKKSNEKKSSVKSDAMSEPTPAPAPGTAQVLATVVSIDSTSSKPTITFNIKKIQGYGAGAPTLSEQTEIKVTISTTNFNRYKKYLSQDKPIQITLSSMQNKTLQGLENEEAPWVLRSVQIPK